MNRQKGYLILSFIIFMSILGTTSNYINVSYYSQIFNFDNLEISDSIAIYSPTDSTVIDLRINTQLTVEWSSGVAAACKIYLFDFSTEVEFLGTFMNMGKTHPGYINSNTVSLSSDHSPGEHYCIKLEDINDIFNYDYSAFFTILNDATEPPPEEDPPPYDPSDTLDNNMFIILMVLSIGGPIGIALAVLITKFSIKRSTNREPKIKKTSLKVYKNHINSTTNEIYDLINQEKLEQASNKLDELHKIINEENNSKLTQIYNERITHIKPFIDNHKIRKIKKVVLDLGTKVSLLEIGEIVERTNVHNTELIENVIRDMINNSEIYAEYNGSVKTVFFDLKENTDAIDKLMKTYRNWEKSKFAKKI
ncbi:MAG: hypothetical protein ACFFDB_11300 [Promethearchaeota archaeon]